MNSGFARLKDSKIPPRAIVSNIAVTPLGATLTFDNLSGLTYKLYSGNTLIASNITNGYKLSGSPGTSITYTIQTVNSRGQTTISDPFTVSYPNYTAIGGNEIIDKDGYRYHIFFGSGTFTPKENVTIDALIVAGGGAGGAGYEGGGGGAGGIQVLQSSQLIGGTPYAVVIGQGGDRNYNARVAGNDGQNSSFNGVTAIGGGGGGAYTAPLGMGRPGGSGGGTNRAVGNNRYLGGQAVQLSMNGSISYGNAGGGVDGSMITASGGGGGATGGGGSGNGTAATNYGGLGGPGLLFANEYDYYYGGGGSGSGTYSNNTIRGFIGGIGGGGVGGGGGASGSGQFVSSGLEGSGGGGGGQRGDQANQTRGGSGIVIIKYYYNPTESKPSDRFYSSNTYAITRIDTTQNQVITNSKNKDDRWLSYGNPLAYVRSSGHQTMVQGYSNFDGTNFYISNTTSLLWGQGDFTIEFNYVPFAWPTSGTYQGLLGMISGSTKFIIFVDYQGYIRININGNVTVFASVNTHPGDFSHIALVRRNGKLTMFVNGRNNGTIDSSHDISISGVPFYLGYGGEAAFKPTNGAISNLRITNGKARYYTDFKSTTIPEYYDIGYRPTIYTSDKLWDYVTMFVKCDNASVKDLTNKNGIGLGDNTRLSYLYAYNGSPSIYFDGTNDCLWTYPGDNFTFGIADFTVEAWVYIVAYGTKAPYTTILTTDGSVVDFGFRIWSDGTLYIASTTLGNINLGAEVVPLNQWTHVAWVRLGSKVYGFINGGMTSKQASINLMSITNPNYVRVGATANYSATGKFYLNELKVTKGKARWTPTTTRLTKDTVNEPVGVTAPGAPIITTLSDTTASITWMASSGISCTYDIYDINDTLISKDLITNNYTLTNSEPNSYFIVAKTIYGIIQSQVTKYLGTGRVTNSVILSVGNDLSGKNAYDYALGSIFTGVGNITNINGPSLVNSRAISLNSPTSYLTAPANANRTKNSISFVSWIYLYSNTDWYIFSRGDAWNIYGGVYFTPGNIWLPYAAYASYTTRLPALALNTWYKVGYTFTVPSGQLKAYRNGSLVGTVNLGATTRNVTMPEGIGCVPGKSDYYKYGNFAFSGMTMYDGELTETQMAWIMAKM